MCNINFYYYRHFLCDDGRIVAYDMGAKLRKTVIVKY